MNNLERRYNQQPVKTEVRSVSGENGTEGKEYIEGVAAQVNQRTMIGSKEYGFYEEIAPGAFDGILDNDVRCLFNHDANFILSRTKSGSLGIYVDADGNLAYRSEVPDRQWARDVKNAIETGDVDGSSFAFRIAEEKWTFRSEDSSLDMDLRTIVRFEQIYDVAPVTYPAYDTTTSSVSKRSLEHYDEVRKAVKPEEKKEIEAFHDDAKFRYKYNLNKSKS